MSDHQVSLPTKPRIVEESDSRGIYEIDGFYPGYGHTIGNSLRRIILSSLPGVAITSVNIDGVSHEFSTIDGVKEDVIRMLLNLKKVRFKIDGAEPQTLKLSIKGPKVVTASDIDAPGQVEVLNKDEYIMEVTSKTNIDIEMKIETGLGYVPKEVLNKDKVDIGSIALDAAFAPIKRVNYEVENMRVGDRTDYNRLRIFIETDGTLTAHEALEKSIEIMIHQLKAIIGFKEEEPEAEEQAESIEDATTDMNDKKDKSTVVDTAEIFKTRIEELKLSQRVESAMTEAGIRTIGGLVRKREEDLLSIQGLGQKGLQEIKRALSNYGVTLRA
jgi:DNA-directed RNA polymerase subunit alpha